MKRWIFFLIISLNFSAFAQLEFSDMDELNEHAWSNTNLDETTTGYNLEFLSPENWEELEGYFNKQQNNEAFTADNILTTLKLIERCNVDFADQFDPDDVLFPIMRGYQGVTPTADFNVPLFIFDLSFSELNEASRPIHRTWTSEEPFPGFDESNFQTRDIFLAAAFIDSIINDNIQLYWDQSTVYSNKEREVSEVSIIIDGIDYLLPEGEVFDLRSFYGSDKFMDDIGYLIKFSDGTSNKGSFLVNVKKNDPEKFSGYPFTYMREFGDSPILQYGVAFGCSSDGNKIDKPFILVQGWGPYTGNGIVNSIQGWPVELPELYDRYNLRGYLDDLRSNGFDIIICKFYPPNDDMRENADLLEQLIELVNEEKYSNGSYQENVIQGYSAGALCVRLALQRMESRHMEEGGPHHHSKLYISVEGEQKGANVPLGIQHATEYLADNYMVGQLNNIYALSQLLNAQLSQNILEYFYPHTGGVGNPGQGYSIRRGELLWEHWHHNHDKNTHVPGYPGFTRNISISNGMNASQINGPLSNHYPYPIDEGHIVFSQSNPTKQWKINFLKSGTSDVDGVFSVRKQIWGNWYYSERYHTLNPLVIDNAPGGVQVLGEQNPVRHVVLQMRTKLPGAPDYYDYSYFAHTPTLLTHDILDFDPSLTGGRMDYNLKTNGLMYTRKIDADNDNLNNASDYYGYPHLKYPDNHYSDYTPFDALFTWHENTEHITTMRIDGNQQPYTGDNQVEMKHFMMNEADIWSMFLQNRQIGWNINENLGEPYKADFFAHETISMGQEVTQRTDFKPFEVLENGIVRVHSATEIDVQPGTHFKPGSSAHLKIEAHSCYNPNPPGKSSSVSNSDNMHFESFETRKINEEDIKEQDIKVEETLNIRVYPNPSDNIVNVEFDNLDDVIGDLQIMSSEGKLLARIPINNKILKLELDKGVYIVRANIKGKWQSKKVIKY